MERCAAECVSCNVSFKKKKKKRREERKRERERECFFTGAVFQYPPLFTLPPSLCEFFLSFFLSPFSCNIGAQLACCKMQPRMSCENIDALWAATVYSGPRGPSAGIIDSGFLLMRPREISMDRCSPPGYLSTSSV